MYDEEGEPVVMHKTRAFQSTIFNTKSIKDLQTQYLNTVFKLILPHFVSEMGIHARTQSRFRRREADESTERTRRLAKF